MELYVLFGTEVCAMLNEGGIEAAKKEMETEVYSLYEWDGNPADLLSEAVGYQDYAILSKEEYEQLKD